MSESTQAAAVDRSVARRRVAALAAAVLLVVAVAAAWGLWYQSWAAHGWLGYAFQGELFEPGEESDDLPGIWFLKQRNYQVLQVMPGSPADRAGLSPRDRVVSVGGVPVADAAGLAALDGRLRPGDEVIVEVARDGAAAGGTPSGVRTVRLRVESPFATPHTAVSSLASAVVALLYLATGLVVFWARPRSRQAIVFTLLSVAGAGFFFLIVFIELSMMPPRGVQPLTAGGFNAVFYAGLILVSFLLTNLILHLALIFPRPRPVVEHRPELLHWVHATPFALGSCALLFAAGMAAEGHPLALAAIAVGGTAVAAAAFVRLRRTRRAPLPWGETFVRRPYASLALPLVAAPLAGSALARLPDEFAAPLFVAVFASVCVAIALLYPLVYAVLALLAMRRSYQESGVEEKRQVRWPLWGLAVCLVGTTVTALVCLLLPQLQPAVLDSSLYHTLSTIVVRIFYLAIPLSFAFAIAKYRLMEVDLVVRKTVVYGATTALVVGGYFAVVGLLGVAFVSWIDLDNPIVTVGATLLVVALFVPVRNRMQRLVDRRFRQDGIDRREALEAMRREVLAAADLGALLPTLAETVQQALQSRAVALFVRPPEGGELVVRAKVGLPDEVLGRLRLPASALAGAGRVADRATLALDERTHGRLKRHRLHCLAPARRQADVVGAVAAADSLAGDDPDADDREFLAAAADQLALAVATLGPRRETVELDEARTLQRSLLPAVLPRPPGADLAGAWHPAREVAGDYYDAIDLGGGRLALCIGDVVGKGMPAALLMSSLQAAVRAVAAPETPPARLCEQVRRVVTSNLAGGRFVTFFYALYDAADRRLAYANAGHVPPLLVRADGGVERLEAGGGAFVRLLAGAGFVDGETTLARGDRLVLFTDGVSEAQSPDGALYGEERLAALVAGNGDADAAALAERITADVRAHAAGDPADDLTLLLLRAT